MFMGTLLDLERSQLVQIDSVVNGKSSDLRKRCSMRCAILRETTLASLVDRYSKLRSGH